MKHSVLMSMTVQEDGITGMTCNM